MTFGRSFASRPVRRVYFAFHYQRDIWRAQQVRNHWVTKEDRAAAGYFDGSLEEKAKTIGETAVKRLINGGMIGSSVTCVLIGAETYLRHWVDYEIFQTVETGMGLFGVRVHQLKDRDGLTDSSGANPFWYLGYGKRVIDKLQPMVRYTKGWTNAPRNDPIARSAAPYLAGPDAPVLSALFRVYDWVDQDGYEDFPEWVAEAASQAGR